MARYNKMQLMSHRCRRRWYSSYRDLCFFLVFCTFTFQTSRLWIDGVAGRTELTHGPVGLDGTRGVARARRVRARVDAREVHARLVRRTAGVPEAHGRDRGAIVGAHAHGPVVERQALFVRRTRVAAGGAIARAAALAVAGAPQVRGTIIVCRALAFRRRAR